MFEKLARVVVLSVIFLCGYALEAQTGSVLLSPTRTQVVTQPAGTTLAINTTQLGSANGVLNPASCGTSAPPSWCSGSDIGAWINAAIAALPGNGASGSYGCGVIQLPYKSLYSPFTTPVVKPRCTLIDLNQSSIGYSGSASFPAFTIEDSFGVSEPALGGIINGRIFGGTGYSPIVARSIGVFLGGILGNPTTGYCSVVIPTPPRPVSTSLCSATFQKFDNLVVQNFEDGFRVGSNSYINSWKSVTIAGNTNGIHYLVSNNSGEDQNFQGSYFINDASHDILIDSGSSPEINIHGGAFDNSGADSIVGAAHLSMSDTHVENGNPGWHFLNCTSGSCSINIHGGMILDLATLTSSDSFGVFGGSNNQAIFDGVEWGIASGQTLSQFFIWNDATPASTLHMENFRQDFAGSLSQTSLKKAALFTTTGAPPTYVSDGRVGGLVPPVSSTTPSGACAPLGSLFNDSLGHLSLCDSTGKWYVIH